MRQFVFLAAASIAVSGCVITSEDRRAFVRAQVQQSQQPTIEIECPEQGCNFRRFAYRDKRAPVRMPQETTAADIITKAIDGVVKLGGIAAPAWAAVELGRAIRDSKSGDTITTTNQQQTTITETHHTEDNDSSVVTTNQDNDTTITESNHTETNSTETNITEDNDSSVHTETHTTTTTGAE